MFPMKPEDAAMLAHRHQHELREQVACDRLAHATRAEQPEGDRPLARHARVAHRLWAGARRIVHPLGAARGTAG